MIVVATAVVLLSIFLSYQIPVKLGVNPKFFARYIQEIPNYNPGMTGFLASSILLIFVFASVGGIIYRPNERKQWIILLISIFIIEAAIIIYYI